MSGGFTDLHSNFEQNSLFITDTKHGGKLLVVDKLSVRKLMLKSRL